MLGAGGVTVGPRGRGRVLGTATGGRGRGATGRGRWLGAAAIGGRGRGVDGGDAAATNSSISGTTIASGSGEHVIIFILTSLLFQFSLHLSLYIFI